MILDNFHQLAAKLLPVVQVAGRVEMEIYQQDFQVLTKKDDSPVTLADQAAERIILKGLETVAPDIPVVAEEAASAGHIPRTGDLFFLVDPLDGTKEFIKKSHEFTVNIALINKGVPVFGIVYVPASGELYMTLSTSEAVKTIMPVEAPGQSLDTMSLQRLAASAVPAQGLRVVSSKSHMNKETENYLKQFDISDIKNAGSSLKFCLLAEGLADLYPRFGPTMEWDTAAGHAILLAAGGSIVTERGDPLSYGKAAQNYLNPFFIAWGRQQAI